MPERVQIGMKVIFAKCADRAYIRRCILRYQITETVRILKKNRAGGYCARTTGDAAILSKHCKGLIREVMHVVDNAYEVEIAGVCGSGMHIQPTVGNQCGVGGGSSWSGIDYKCQLLFRAVSSDGANHVAYLHPMPLVSEHRIALEHNYVR
jgi:hypothetical protein